MPGRRDGGSKLQPPDNHLRAGRRRGSIAPCRPADRDSPPAVDRRDHQAAGLLRVCVALAGAEVSGSSGRCCRSHARQHRSGTAAAFQAGRGSDRRPRGRRHSSSCSTKSARPCSRSMRGCVCDLRAVPPLWCWRRPHRINCSPLPDRNPCQRSTRIMLAAESLSGTDDEVENCDAEQPLGRPNRHKYPNGCRSCGQGGDAESELCRGVVIWANGFECRHHHEK